MILQWRLSFFSF